MDTLYWTLRRNGCRAVRGEREGSGGPRAHQPGEAGLHPDRGKIISIVLYVQEVVTHMVIYYMKRVTTSWTHSIQSCLSQSHSDPATVTVPMTDTKTVEF